jgi:hypothetical protein
MFRKGEKLLHKNENERQNLKLRRVLDYLVMYIVYKVMHGYLENTKHYNMRLIIIQLNLYKT